ncbi:MAG: SGNH/GDSL hydrolase family protein [Planctomycetes bacterium]|nr:SGNH/GDSL hydrolase family protein [Planctomycetota bacterium]
MQAPAPRRRRWLARAALAVVAPLAFAGLAELAIVASGFSYPPDTSPISVFVPEGEVEGRKLHERDARELWRPAPGASVPWGRDVVNAAGCRGPLLERAKTTGVVRIAALGDSSTFGYGVRYEECWAGRLAGELETRGVRAEVLDAGVIGSTVRMGHARYSALVRDYAPDVVIAAYGAVNEHAASIGKPDDVLIRELAFQRGAFGRVAERLRAESRLAQLAAWWVDEARGGRAQIEQERREARAWIGKHLETIGRSDWAGERRVSVAEYGRFLRELVQAARGDGARCVLLAPGRQDVVERETPVLLDYTAATKDAARELGVPLVDGRAAMGAEGDAYDALYLDHFHPTPEGHRRLAARLAETVNELVRGR